MSMNLAVGKLMDPNPRVIWKAFDGDPVVVLARVNITAVTLIQVAGIGRHHSMYLCSQGMV